MTNLEQPSSQTPSSRSVNDIQDDGSTLYERHPDWPKKVNVSLYLSFHANKVDMEGITPHLDNADIVLYELATATEEGLQQAKKVKQMYNKVSVDPDRDLDYVMDWAGFEGTSDEPVLRGIYGSGKAVGTLDVGSTQGERELVEGMNEAMYPLSRGIANYEDTLDMFRELHTDFASLQQERERIMVEKFEVVVEEILNQRPDLKSKENLNIVISMGSGHESMHELFGSIGIPVEKHFGHADSYSKDYGGQLIEAISKGVEPSNELVQRAFTQRVLSEAIGKEIKDTSLSSEEYLKYLRHYVSELYPEDMMDIFQLWNKDMATAANIDSMLAETGMPRLARSAKEIIDTNRWLEEQQHDLGEVAAMDIKPL